MDAIRTRMTAVAAALLATAIAGGCQGRQARSEPVPVAPLPRELDMVTQPEYRVAPPDILVIEAVRAIPNLTYRIAPTDALFIDLTPSLPEKPLSGVVPVDLDGTIDLGPDYHRKDQPPLRVAGLTLPQAREAIEKHLRVVAPIKDARVTVTLAQTQTPQRISGPHLVRPDGTISLGTYGSVQVAGMTLAEVRRAVEAKLSESLLDPEVSVDVQSYNSKLYYVILDGGGAGQTVYRLPVTGNDTVLDAISQVSGLSAVSSKDHIWLSRPAPVGAGHQVFPIDWRAVSECGDTATNYQLLAGDRVYVAAYPLIQLDTTLARVFAPIERVFGITLLGSATIRSLDPDSNRGTGGGGFFP